MAAKDFLRIILQVIDGLLLSTLAPETKQGIISGVHTTNFF